MGSFQKAFNLSAKRPFIIIFLAVLSFFFCLVDQYNPFFTVLFNMVGPIQEGNLNVLMTLDSVIDIIKFIFEIQNMKYILIFLLIFSLAVAVLTGLLLSGYFYVMNNVMKDLPQSKGEYLEGLKKYFYKVGFLTFKLVLLSGLFILFMMVAAVPAIASVKAIFTQNTQFSLPSILLALITLVVIFLAGIFLQASVIFWLPCIMNDVSSAFKKGKQLSDKNFWSIFPKVLIFNILLLVYGCIHIFAKYSFAAGIEASNTTDILIFILNWVYITFYAFMLVIYVFSAFREYQ